MGKTIPQKESKKALNMSKKQILKLVVLQIIILLPLFLMFR